MIFGFNLNLLSLNFFLNTVSGVKLVFQFTSLTMIWAAMQK
jgi:hypothetical protein